MTTERRNWIVLERVRLHCGFFGAYLDSVFLQSERRSFGKGAESGSERPTDHAVTDAEVILKMRDAYLAKAAADPTNDPTAAEAIRAHFDQMNATLRSLEKERAEAEPKQLEALLQFAARAYRRPLTQAERADLLAYYHQARAQNQLSHEEALRDAITSVLMEPDFLYRLDMTEPQTASSSGAGSHAVALKTSTAVPLSHCPATRWRAA